MFRRGLDAMDEAPGFCDDGGAIGLRGKRPRRHGPAPAHLRLAIFRHEPGDAFFGASHKIAHQATYRKRSGIVPGEAASRKPRVSPSSNALKMSAAAALTPSRVFLMCALVGVLTAATPRSTARHGPHIFKNLTSHAGGSSPVMARATIS